MAAKSWSPDTFAAVDAADRRRTKAWCVAVRALTADGDLGACRRVYADIMRRVDAQWKRDIDAALALSDGAEF